jgi:Skp family chaperone for outer membrane proteins
MRKPRSVAATALALLAAGFSAAWAQDAPAVFRVGVVDLELVGRKFERKLQEEEALNQWYYGEQQYLRELGGYIFCVDTEWERAGTLLRAPKVQRTKEQQDELKSLLDAATGRETEYQDLRAKQAGGPLTAEEKNKFALVEDIAKSRDGELTKLVEGLEGQLQQRMAALREELMKPVRESVNAVATEKGLALIVEKDYVYFGGEDVTEDVVKKLNEMAPPAAGASTPTPPAGGAAPGGEPPKEGDGGRPAEGGGNP